MIEDSVAAQASVQADHRLPLPGSEWALWRRVGLRSAGFPAALVHRLSVPECVAAATELCAAEEALAAALDAAAGQLRERSGEATSQGEGGEVEKLRLRKALRRIRKGKPPEDPDVLAPEVLAALAGAAGRVAAASRAYESSFEEALARQSRELQEVARSASFRTAILWQNRKVFEAGLDRLARTEPDEAGRNQRRRGSERLLASYLQRYTVKNDTIGAFGPSGWATLVDGAGTSVRPGPEVVASRSLYLEAWGLEEIARRLAKEPAARPDLPPVRRPFVRLEGNFLTLPMQRPVRLQPVRTALLTACDGSRTAREIAAYLLSDPRFGLRGEAEVYQLLENLRASNLIEWDFQVPLHPNAAGILRRQIEGVQDPAARGVGLAAMEELEAGCLALAAARDPEALDRGLACLEGTYSRLTGAPPERNPGMTYGGRTLVYEECRRDVEVELGPEIHQALAEPLELVLWSARWFTFEVARQVRRTLEAVYRGLAPAGSGPVEMIDFWPRLQGVEPELVQLIEGVKSSLHRRWQEILAGPPGERRLDFRCAELRERVEASFAAPAPGWPLARYHNPDVMIAASGVEALRRGDFQLVLGEVHVAACSLNVWALLSECVEREEVFADLDADFPEPRVVFLEPRDLPGLTARTRRAHFSSRDLLIAPPDGESPLPGHAALPLSELVLVEKAGELCVTHRDGRLAAPLVDFLGDLLTIRSTNQFSLLDPQRHAPRITIDRLVVCRESWSFDSQELEFAWIEEGAGRFLAAQRWLRTQGLPHVVFVRTPVEQKPFYVDFASPISLDILAHAVRRARDTAPGRPVRLFEMLPGTREVWLPDTEGQLYASELRIMAVDLSAFTPSGKADSHR